MTKFLPDTWRVKHISQYLSINTEKSSLIQLIFAIVNQDGVLCQERPLIEKTVPVI